MSVTGIVCEYNPFHRGHAYLIDRLRGQDPDTAIVCVLSGGFVQRGEPALFPTSDRAAAALACGADLVLLLPFPYCMAPAEIFAESGMFLLRAAGCDSIAFGTEGDVLPRLKTAAAHLSSDEFEEAFRSALRSPENAGCGYPALRAQVYESLYGAQEAALLRTPNNLLAAEYLRASSELVPIAVPRIGDAHDAPLRGDDSVTASASAVRALFLSGRAEEALSLLPPPSAEIFSRAVRAGSAASENAPAASALLLWHYRSTPAEALSRYAGLGGGLAGRFCSAAREASDLCSFFSLAKTKKYTDAALRRAAWFGFFGVTEEELHTPPAFLQVLALNERGAAVLKHIRKTCPVPVLSRFSSFRKLPEEQRRLVLRSFRAEQLRNLLSVSPVSEADCFRKQITVCPSKTPESKSSEQKP